MRLDEDPFGGAGFKINGGVDYFDPQDPRRQIAVMLNQARRRGGRMTPDDAARLNTLRRHVAGLTPITVMRPPARRMAPARGGLEVLFAAMRGRGGTPGNGGNGGSGVNGGGMA